MITTTDRAERLKNLSPAKRALLLKAMQQQAARNEQDKSIRRRPQQGSIPLSFAQQRLWFLDQLLPGSAFYNIPVAVRLSGRLSSADLERSFAQIVQRHESLRTTFSTVGGETVQLISEPGPIHLPVEDLTHLAEAEREAMAQQLALSDAQQSFDLARGPLWRVKLLRLDEEDYVLLMTMHHIISDGWSVGILIREVATLYQAFVQGRSAKLPELPIQYADYAVWQRQWLTDEALDEHLAYWKQQLGGAPVVLELPTDRPRPAMQTYRGGRKTMRLSKQLAEGLRRLSQEEGATLFMTLLAAYQTLLYRLTGQKDICVGTPIAGRTRVETEGLVGLFLNTLVLRTDMSGEPNFRELLRRVKGVTLGAFAHQEVPFEKLVEEVQPVRNMSHSPLFQVMLVLQNTPSHAVELPGLKIGALGFESTTGTAKFDLSLSMTEEEEGLTGVLRYNADLFDAATIERLLAHFRMLLEAAVGDPERAISTMTLLTDSERHQMLVEWNNTAREYPTEGRLHQLFEAQVERTPDAIALVYADEQLSYRELNERANQLAHHLRELGVGTDVLVGVLMERSVEMVVSLLAILKAGGAYVPLDPQYPMERLSFMLDDADVAVLLTQQRLLDTLPEHGAEVICLDGDWPETIARHSPENPVNQTTAYNLAYCIYTSGSTGQPKGVMNTHQGICNRLLWMQEAYQLDETDRVLQKTPFSFDVSVWEFFWPLLTGARLVIARPRSHHDPAYLVELISEEQITTLHFVPSMLQLFLEEHELERCQSLRRVICSGEALSYPLQERFFGRMKAELHNLYGPTEAAVDVTYWACERESERRVVPIGRPIANTQTYVLDERMQVVEVGVAGELYLAGAGLARGYLKRAGLTAEKFIPDPFSREPGARLYRTGDLARYLPDGNVEYLGRMDYQVKVRGFRIELGEIEVALALHPAVREAVVVAREDESGDKRLMAYVVAPQGEEVPSVSELQSFLKSKLPEYMVPALFMILDALPLSTNGKVDRRALPAPDRSRPQLEKEYVAPRTPLEQWLTDMLKKILGLEQIGIHDNFFELGGDSIKGAVFINRLQEALGQYVYVVAIFDAPTIAQLAVYLMENYLESVAQLFGAEPLPIRDESGERIDAAKVTKLRQVITPLPPLEGSAGESRVKNRPAIFVLSPPRSGSTLLRVMLAGHPQLFAPPELELLSFNTLEDRRAAFTGRNSFSLEGTLRALMELKQCSAEEAKQVMQQYEEEGLTTRQFYGLLQEWVGECRLVDKTPSYALDQEILKRAESDFDQAQYVHLVRHPSAMVLSFEEARLDQVFFRHPHEFGRRELAELIWVVSQENILDFLREVPAERQHFMQFEELLREPRRVMERLCEFLGIEFTEAMIEPYRDKEQRMTDGIHPESKMHGDMKFHEHQGIDARTAERWKENGREGELGEITWQLAERLGYARLEARGKRIEESVESIEEGGKSEDRKRPEPALHPSLVEIQAGDSGQPFFCVHPLGGNVLCYFDLARHLGMGQSFYGLQAHGLNGEYPQDTQVEAIAAHYIEAVRSVQPEGPYALGGWSMGGVVAFEMAQQLQARGQKIATLALLDAFAPTGKRRSAKIEERQSLIRFAFNLGLTLDQLTVPLEQVAQLKPDEQLVYMMDLAQLSEIIPADMTLQHFRRLFDVFKTNIRAVQSYEPQAYPGRVTLFRASERVARVRNSLNSGWKETLLRGAQKNVGARGAQAQNMANGWATLAAEGVDVCLVPGNHYTMLRKPHVQALAEQLKTHLDQGQVAELVIR